MHIDWSRDTHINVIMLINGDILLLGDDATAKPSSDSLTSAAGMVALNAAVL